MEKRLVDVLDSKGSVIHTYPITLDESGGAATEAQFKAKALEAAAGSMAKCGRRCCRRRAELGLEMQSCSKTTFGRRYPIRSKQLRFHHLPHFAMLPISTAAAAYSPSITAAADPIASR